MNGPYSTSRLWFSVAVVGLIAVIGSAYTLCRGGRRLITSDLEAAVSLSAVDVASALSAGDGAQTSDEISRALSRHPFVGQIHLLKPSLNHGSWIVVDSATASSVPVDADGDGMIQPWEAPRRPGSSLEDADRPGLVRAASLGMPATELVTARAGCLVAAYVPLPASTSWPGGVVVAETHLPAVRGIPMGALHVASWLLVAGAAIVAMAFGLVRVRGAAVPQRDAGAAVVKALAVEGTSVLAVDESGAVRVWEGALEGWFGAAAEDAIGRSASEVLPAGVWEVAERLIGGVLASGECAGPSMAVGVGDGEGAVWLRALPILGAGAAVEMVVVVFRECACGDARRVWSALVGERWIPGSASAGLSTLCEVAGLAKAYVVRGSSAGRLRVSDRCIRSAEVAATEAEVLSAAHRAMESSTLHVDRVEAIGDRGPLELIAVPFGRVADDNMVLVAIPLPGVRQPEFWCALELGAAQMMRAGAVEQAEQMAPRLHLVPAPALLVGNDGAITDCNAEARLMIWGDASPEGAGFGRLEDICPVSPNVLRAAGAVGRFQGTVTLSTPDGRSLMAMLSVKRLYDGSGTACGFIAVAADVTQEESAITSLRTRNEELEEANSRLDSIDDRRTRFLADMSHELRTPLNSIIGFSEILMDGMGGRLSGDSHEFITSIHEGGSHLLEIVNDILDLSKIEAGRLVLRRGPCDVAALINYARLTVSAMSETKGLRLDVAIAPDLPVIDGDQLRLRQVLLNLMSNAVKFTPDGGAVTVSALRDGDDLIIAVRDTGIGISVSDQRVIFEPFRQVNISAEVQGTGLGLPITKRLIEMHGGDIELESEPGRGSVFTVRLPVTAQLETSDAPSPPSSDSHDETGDVAKGVGIETISGNDTRD